MNWSIHKNGRTGKVSLEGEVGESEKWSLRSPPEAEVSVKADKLKLVGNSERITHIWL